MPRIDAIRYKIYDARYDTIRYDVELVGFENIYLYIKRNGGPVQKEAKNTDSPGANETAEYVLHVPIKQLKLEGWLIETAFKID